MLLPRHCSSAVKQQRQRQRQHREWAAQKTAPATTVDAQSRSSCIHCSILLGINKRTTNACSSSSSPCWQLPRVTDSDNAEIGAIPKLKQPGFVATEVGLAEWLRLIGSNVTDLPI